MALASKIYISTSSLGDATKCSSQVDELYKELDSKLKAGRIAGYRCRTFTDLSALGDEDVTPEAVIKATGGVFPCVWTNITWDGSEPSDIAAIEAKFSLKSF